MELLVERRPLSYEEIIPIQRTIDNQRKRPNAYTRHDPYFQEGLLMPK